MSLQKTLLKVAAGYAIKRMTEDMTADDAKRYAGEAQKYARKAYEMTPDEWRSAAWEGLDSGLLRAGLMRRANASNNYGLIAGGVLAGVVVGAGAAYLYATPETRQKLIKAIEDIIPTSLSDDDTENATVIETRSAPTGVEPMAQRPRPNGPRN